MPLARHAKSVLAGLIGLLVLGLLSEGALRLASAFGAGSQSDERYNAKMSLSKNRDLVFEMNPFDPLVNAEGLRDYDYPVEKPPNTFRIVAVGDSITYGHSLPLEASFPKQLETRLNRDGNPQRFEVMNFGVGGYNTLQELALYKLKGAKYDPDLVLIGYSLNDVLSHKKVFRNIGQAMGRTPARKAAPPPAAARAARTRPPEATPLYRRSLLVSWLLDRWSRVEPARRGVARFFVALYDEPSAWAIVADGFAGFGALARESSRPFVVVIFPYLDDLENYRYRAIHEQVAREARRNGLGVIDLLDVFEGRDPGPLRLSSGDYHPSAEGNRLTAAAIESFLEAKRVSRVGSAP